MVNLINNIKEAGILIPTPLSSAAEHQAHNLGVTGSKPVGGILVFIRFITWYRHFQDIKPAWRRGKRAGLITPRT